MKIEITAETPNSVALKALSEGLAEVAKDADNTERFLAAKTARLDEAEAAWKALNWLLKIESSTAGEICRSAPYARLTQLLGTGTAPPTE